MPQAIKADASMTCSTYIQHTRLMSAQQTGDRFTAHPFLFGSCVPPYIYVFFSCIDSMDILPVSTVTGIFPAKLAAMRQPSNSACGHRTVNNLPFPRKRVFFTHNLSVCLSLRLVWAENIPPQAEMPRKEGKKRFSECRGSLLTMPSESFFNEVKEKMIVSLKT